MNNNQINQLDNLPVNLTQCTDRRFSLMQLEEDKQGRVQKKPINVKSGKLLFWKKHPEYLVDYNTALKALKSKDDKNLRLGVLLQHNWADEKDLIAIDIDHRPDLVDQIQNGKITSNDIQSKVVQFGFKHNFYIEISQSGKGLHLLQLGHKNNKKLIRNDKFEYYDNKRWICLTGNAINKVKELGTDDITFKQLESMMFPQISVQKSPTASTFNSSNLTVDEIIKKAKNAKDGQKFQQLYNGASPSGDVSADDLAFVDMIARQSPDPDKIDAVFRRSERMRKKWNDKHYANGETYGQHTINVALHQTKASLDNRPAYAQIDKSKIKSNADLIKALKKARSIWDAQNGYQDKQGNFHPTSIMSKPTDIITILINVVNFAVIYSNSRKDDINLYFYNYDKGIYSQDEREMEQLILAVVPEMINGRTRENILKTIFNLPTDKVPEVKNSISSAKGRTSLAVGNGILDLETKKLEPYTPQKYITSKIDTNYNPMATKEPQYNGWSWSQSLEEISEGNDEKKHLLWQICKAAIIGAYWLRQAVLLIDDGHGETGKSTFEDALAGVVGESNTASLRLSEFSDETKLVDAVDKRLIIGDDNDVNTAIKRYDYLNPVISSEVIRVRNFYQKSQATRIHAFILQSCNGIPPFKNATTAFFKRLVLVQFNHRHNAAKIENWRVKFDYIKRQEFKEWLLWHVVNIVDLDISLQNTQENQDLIQDVQTETDTIANFVENWLPKLESTVIPSSWLYAFYSTTCVIDKMDKIFSQKRFSRELMNNGVFASHWQRKAKRISSSEFLFDDALKLVKLCTSTRWGKGVKAWFPVTQKTIIDKETGTSNSSPTILKSDYDNIIKNFHGNCFIKKE